MADLTYYAAKIAECLRLLESSNDPLYRNVYQAMSDEFAEKYAALQRRMVADDSPSAPPSALLHHVAPPVTPANGSGATRPAGQSAPPQRATGHARQSGSLVDQTPRDASPLIVRRV